MKVLYRRTGSDLMKAGGEGGRAQITKSGTVRDAALHTHGWPTVQQHRRNLVVNRIHGLEPKPSF